MKPYGVHFINSRMIYACDGFFTKRWKGKKVWKHKARQLAKFLIRKDLEN